VFLFGILSGFRIMKIRFVLFSDAWYVHYVHWLLSIIFIILVICTQIIITKTTLLVRENARYQTRFYEGIMACSNKVNLGTVPSWFIAI
jgi:hypothetical protein